MTRGPARLLRAPLHVLGSLPALLAALRSRGRSVLVFTHEQDRDRDGRDHQMGPLVGALLAAGPVLEVALVPLDALRDARRRRGRPFVSYTALLVLARLCCPLGRRGGRGLAAARALVCRALLRLARPQRAFLIDESGSGQPLVAAARRLGIPTVGIQHGDFRPGNPQYDSGRAGRARLPADLLCVWSPWFRERLLAISTVWDERNTAVTGRLRHDAAPRPLPSGPTTLLVCSEDDAAFAEAAAPFLERLRHEPDLRVLVRRHPADRGMGTTPFAESPHESLADALHAAHVVLGIRSSALLEAAWRRRPAVVLVSENLGDAAGFAAAGLAAACDDPARLADLCRRLAGPDGTRLAELARATVWGGAPPDPVVSVLDLANRLTSPRSAG